MQTISSLFYYLFTPYPGSEFKFYIPMIILIILLIGGGIAFSIVYKMKKKEDPAFKKLFAKTAGRLILMGILFMILTLVRFESIPYFSMRLWLYLSLALLAFFVYITIKTYRTKYPKEKENFKTKMAFRKKQSKENRYSPNKKKR